MVKAMAIAQGWEYERHSNFSQVLNLAYLATNTPMVVHPNFSQVLNLAYLATNDDRIRLLRGIPNELHGNYYRRKRHLDEGMVGRDLDSTAELLDLLQPLTE